MPSWIRLFTKVDGGDGIFRVEYESAIILEHREELLESKQPEESIKEARVRFLAIPSSFVHYILIIFLLSEVF